MKKIRPGVIIWASILLCVLLIIAAIIFTPRIYAQKRINTIKDLLGAQAVDYAIILDPNGAGDLMPEEYEVMVEGEEFEELSALLLNALDSAKYGEKKKSPVGNWDVRIRLYHDGGFSDLYIGVGSVYVANKTVNYHYNPTDKDALSLKEYLDGLLSRE